jgi:lysophospholipid acyltransferase (LPLAT)-like uncharacterized protein
VTTGHALPPRRRIKKLGIQLAAVIAPVIYLAYMRLVALTSKIHRREIDEIFDRVDLDVNVTLAILHQDVFMAPFMFRDRAILTLANIGDAGDIVTALLERCGFEVARGGTSSRSSRRTSAVIRSVIQRARDTPEGKGIITAFTPDGSHGPAGAIRPGVALLAIKLGAELYCMKVHASRAIYLNTWDRTMIPLPFGKIWVDVDGPVALPSRATRDELESCRRTVEDSLHRLHRKAFARDGRQPVPTLQPLQAGGASPEGASE